MSWVPPEVPPGGELREALPQAGWRAAAAQILARHGLPSEGLAPFPAGSDVVWGAGAHVVKLSEPRWAEAIENEARTLAHVAAALPLDTPRPVAQGRLGGWPYVVMTRVHGEALGTIWSALDRRGRLALSAALGELLATLRAAPLPPLEEHSAAWQAFMTARLEGAVAWHRRRGAGEAWLAQLPPFLAATPRPPMPLALLHTELLGDHVLLEQRGGAWRPCALLDFADARVGDPRYEIAALVEFVFKGEPGCLGACLEAAGDPLARGGEAAGRELLAWALLHRFASLPRALAAAGGAVDLEDLARRLYSP